MSATETYWFVGFTKPNHEKKVSEELDRLGVENYLAMQKVRRKWSNRIKVVDKLVMPRMIFIKTTYAQRIKLLELVYSLTSYMTTKGPHTPVVVPEKQMRDFRFMVDHTNADVLFEMRPLAPGDPVEIVNGTLTGIRGELVRIDGTKYVAIRLGELGSALVEIPIESVERITDTTDS